MRVLIIGGGVVGLSVALRLRDLGVEVLVLERSLPGAEASSAAAGMLAPQMEASGPGPFLDLCLLSRALYPGFAAELRERAGMDIGFLACGTFWLAFDEETEGRQNQAVRWQGELGLRVERVTGEEARRQEPLLSSLARQAVLFPDDHQVDNRLLVRALVQATTHVGVRFRSGNVRGLLQNAEQVRGVDVDGERVEADAVVVAAGSWTSLVPGLPLSPQAVRPAKGQMVSLQMRTPPLKRVACAAGGYVVPRADGRVICGSTLELRGFDKDVTAQGLAHVLQTAMQICPALSAATLGESWAGLRPYTEDHLPILGKGPLEKLYLATGHFRNGILLAPLTGQLMAAVVVGRAPEADLAPFSPSRPGVLVGNPAQSVGEAKR
jgi:glycine oxidase